MYGKAHVFSESDKRVREENGYELAIEYLYDSLKLIYPNIKIDNISENKDYYDKGDIRLNINDTSLYCEAKFRFDLYTRNGIMKVEDYIKEDIALELWSDKPFAGWYLSSKCDFIFYCGLKYGKILNPILFNLKKMRNVNEIGIDKDKILKRFRHIVSQNTRHNTYSFLVPRYIVENKYLYKIGGTE